MIIRNFEYLLALARERHFSRAAAACHVSQPTLSGGIKQLEEDMDVRIVKRGRSFEGFTVEGERVLAWAQQMMDDCQRLKQELQSFRESAMQGPFRIGVLPATTSLGSTLSVPFAQQAPALDLSIRTSSAADLLNLLRAGELDIALTYLDESIGDGLSTHLLYCERMFCFTSSAEMPASPTWEQILAQPLCILTSGLPAAMAARLADAARVLYTDSTTVLAAHVRSGAWSTLLPQSLAGVLARTTSLRALPMRKSVGAQANVGFVTQRRNPLPPTQHALMEMAHSPELVSAIREMLAAHEPLLEAKNKRTPR